eukprot:11856363-Alexandrium_andersonii.AAC.1
MAHPWRVTSGFALAPGGSHVRGGHQGHLCVCPWRVTAEFAWAPGSSRVFGGLQWDPGAAMT